MVLSQFSLWYLNGLPTVRLCFAMATWYRTESLDTTVKLSVAAFSNVCILIKIIRIYTCSSPHLRWKWCDQWMEWPEYSSDLNSIQIFCDVLCRECTCSIPYPSHILRVANYRTEKNGDYFFYILDNL